MQSEVPKQYLPLVDKTVIEHALDRLLSFPAIAGVILVLHPNDQYWHSLNYQSDKPLFVATGGDERLHSVYNGLTLLKAQLEHDCLALVHDAVRPLVSHLDLERLIATARSHQAGAVLGSPVADTLKQQDDDGLVVGTVMRKGLWRAFTPQVFYASLLHEALASVIENNQLVTDDSSAVELLGLTPKLVAGSAENIKITLPEDLDLARQIWLRQKT